jgi:hypothetical protein
MQTTITQYHGTAVPGQLDSQSEDFVIDSWPASVVIPFGVVVEVANDAVNLPISTSLGTVAGISVFADARMGGTYAPGGSSAYQVGEMVPVLRRGRIYANYHGGSQSNYGSVNVWHPSTDGSSNLKYAGYITNTATSTTAGQEIAALSNAVTPRTVSDSGLCLVSVNFT